jgi:hypothetical protein
MTRRFLVTQTVKGSALLARTARRRLLPTLAAVVAMPALAAAQATTQVVEYYTTDAIGSVRAVTKQVNGQWPFDLFDPQTLRATLSPSTKLGAP